MVRLVIEIGPEEDMELAVEQVLKQMKEGYVSGHSPTWYTE